MRSSFIRWNAVLIAVVLCLKVGSPYGREVIDIPPVTVRIIHHRIMRHRCGVCDKQYVASADLSGQVVGKRRISVRLMSLIGYLKTVCRLPVRTIQSLLKSLYGLSLCVGAIIDILHDIAKRGADTYEQLRQAIRGSPYVHADETGWREDGHNGYLWSFSTPDVRYFTYNKSRAHTVPEEVLGSAYQGMIVSDFYGGYSYHLGLHQRCWVHLLRDLDALTDKHPDDPSVHLFVQEVKQLYREARAFSSEKRKSRVRAREDFQKRLVKLAKPYAKASLPQSVLAQRMVRFEPELFQFVEHPQVPSDNNAAERSLRPSVIDRKITGGTRSAEGSRTKSILMSVFGTWRAQGTDTLQACRELLNQNQPVTITSHQP